MAYSYYTEKNGLAQFWNRDITRLEWARWVYHHPEQTEKLIEMLLQMNVDSTKLDQIIARLDINDANDIKQSDKIQILFNALASILTNQDIDNITGVNIDDPEYNIDYAFNGLTNEEIDNITGVDLGGN